MAHHKSAIKRIRTSESAKLFNRGYKKRLRLAVKSLHEATDQKGATEPLNRAISLIDKMAAKNIFHKNNASNQKSRLMRYYNRLA